MKIQYIAWTLATIILAFIVHISAVLAIPYLSENDAWKRLLNATEVNQMRIIEPLEDTEQLWSFRAPDMKHAICRYDVTKGPVQVDFILLRGYWSVAIYDVDGRNFYAADGFDLQRQRSSLLLLGPDDIKTNEGVLPINVPSPQGLLVLRAPVDSGIMDQTITNALNHAKCEQLVNAPRSLSPELTEK